MKTLRKQMFFGIGVAAAVIFLFAGCAKKQIKEDAVVTFLVGDVQIQRGSESREAKLRDVLKNGDVIATGAESYAVVQAGERLVFRIEANTKAEMTSITEYGKNEFRLDKGLMLSKLNKLGKGDHYFIKTPTAVASVRGTMFSAEYNENISNVAVTEGKVSVVQISTEKEEFAEAGTSASVADGIAKREINAVEKLTLKKIEGTPVIEDLGVMNDVEADHIGKDIRRNDEAVDEEINKILKEKMSLEEIKAEYGRVDIVKLYTGKVYRGVILSRGAVVKIKTPEGTVNIEAKKIKQTESR